MPNSLKGQVAVAIMARSPTAEPHTIKTRLRGVVPDDAARAALYRAFVSDTLALARSISGAVVRVAFTPEGGTVGFAELGVTQTELIAQRGDDLGARERALFEDLFADGFAHVIVMGSDFPTLPASALVEAAAALVREPRAVVLGPARDGGYYAVGLSNPNLTSLELPDLFSNIRWSTPHTFSDTLARAASAGRTVRKVLEWFDVDDEEGWTRLVTSLQQPSAATRAPHTADAVAALGLLRR